MIRLLIAIYMIIGSYISGYIVSNEVFNPYPRWMKFIYVLFITTIWPVILIISIVNWVNKVIAIEVNK
jgi:hypothetical protein